MTVAELIEALRDYPESAEVRLGVQPSWPMQHTTAAVISDSELEFDPEDHNADEGVVYILEGQQVGYFTKRAWDEAGV